MKEKTCIAESEFTEFGFTIDEQMEVRNDG